MLWVVPPATRCEGRNRGTRHSRRLRSSYLFATRPLGPQLFSCGAGFAFWISQQNIPRYAGDDLEDPATRAAEAHQDDLLCPPELTAFSPPHHHLTSRSSSGPSPPSREHVPPSCPSAVCWPVQGGLENFFQCDRRGNPYVRGRHVPERLTRVCKGFHLN